MRCLVVSQLFHPQHEAGAERVARRTAKLLRARGHDVHVLASRDRDGPDDNEQQGIPVRRLHYRNLFMPKVGPLNRSAPVKLLWHGWNAVGGIDAGALRALLREIAPDVIYLHNSHMFQPQLGRAARALGIPIVVHVHDFSWLCPNIGMIRRGRNCARPCPRCRFLTSGWRAAARPAEAIAVSQFVRDRYVENGVFPTAQWHVLRNVDDTPLGREPEPADGTKDAAKAGTTFGFIGSIIPAKGIECLLEAFSHLEPGTAKLRIAGTGERSYVTSLMRKWSSGHIEWLGHVRPEEFYPAIDVLVVPSLWHEPQALVIVEAIRRRIPVIASRRGGNTEVVEGTRSGLLFDPDAKGDLIAAIRCMASMAPAERARRFDFAADGILPDTREFADRVEEILLSACQSTVAP